MLESAAVCEAVATELDRLRARFPSLRIVFKGSFDKANRTSLSSPRGPGLEKGLEMLREVKDRFGFETLTDIHLPEQAARAAEGVTVLQIPAFLCRQTDLLVAAAATDAIVNVKKGQFLSPGEMQYPLRKLEAAGARDIWLTERGTTFGYRNLVVDMRAFPQMAAFGRPVIFDATHSVQTPGGATTSGKREFVPTLACAAVAAGADGLFVETHPDPDKALSDGPNQIPLENLGELMEKVMRLREAVNG